MGDAGKNNESSRSIGEHEEMSDLIHCVGDSHASLFSGQAVKQPMWPEKANDILPQFKTYKVGPSLAYNLCELKTTTRGRERLFKILKTIPVGSYVMLCFGEIDCRAHIMKRAEKMKKSPDAIAQTVAKRYFSVIMEVVKLGYKVLVWNAIPSSYLNKLRQDRWPVYGTVQQRNKVTKVFNEFVKIRCANKGIPFIDVFDHFVDENLMTKKEFFRDDIHLSPETMPIILEELRKYVDV